MGMMESPSDAAFSAFSSSLQSDELRRVKFLCSFGGSILPRPLDGKLRYVGGETRIVSVPRDVTYEELMLRMRDLFDGAWSLKYQQPDEDLDALISVVNDDDVTNMMEEYDKLGAGGDGFTRLRIFLFSHPDHDSGASSSSPAGGQFDSSDERETERRYVDALNSLIDGKPTFEGGSMADLRSFGVSDQFSSHRGIEASMRRLNIPHQASVGQRFSDAEGPRSPVYRAPAHHLIHDPLELPLPLSPSSSLRPHHPAFGEPSERISEEFARQTPTQHSPHHPGFVESMVWLPPSGVLGEKAGFPGNLGHVHAVCEPNNRCEHCMMALRRAQLTTPEARFHDGHWNQWQTHLDHLNPEGDFACRVPGAAYPDCVLFRDNPSLDHHHVYPGEVHGQERGRFVQQHQLNHHLEDPRLHYAERFPVDRNGSNFPHHHGNYYELHMMPSNRNYVHSGEVIHDHHAPGIGSHVPLSRVDDGGIHYGVNPMHVSDPPFQRAQGPPPVSSFSRTALGTSPTYEEPGSMLQLPSNGTSQVRIPKDVNDQMPTSWNVHGTNRKNKVFPTNGPATHDNYYSGKALNPEFHMVNKESKHQFFPDFFQPKKDLPRITYPLSNVGDPTVRNPEPSRDVVNGFRLPDKSHQMSLAKASVESKPVKIPSEDEQDMKLDPRKSVALKKEISSEEANSKTTDSKKCSNLPPDFIASVKVINLEDAGKARETVQEMADVSPTKELVDRGVSLSNSEPMPTQEELDADMEADEPAISKIELTVEEEEALSKGLQTIRNSDLEEIRELGCGTYGSVYHGKWKGSDVAIKRIKASCFAGKPSERKRLIADFWKEALILSSVHHPNVVSFYGVVRDGPDGSLATVTEFMVNGSLKQVLQKKDRTIDRRKRIIIAMDAAFGMEYLHGKNIVHFDLKCENLLVNMRDPHRPVCKIGDLGLSKVKQKTLVSGGLRGTLPWMAPELLSGKTNMVCEKIDVYSFGIVLWELLTGEEPYADMHSASIIGGIVNNTLRPTIPTWCDPEWKALMETCWSTNPVDRPPFSEVSQRLRKLAATVNVK
ncbi:kinase superfamily with octicosapeptide/Phox/Bem1p domain-containing protein [Wolffia australiana]